MGFLVMEMDIYNDKFYNRIFWYTSVVEEVRLVLSFTGSFVEEEILERGLEGRVGVYYLDICEEGKVFLGREDFLENDIVLRNSYVCVGSY